MTSYELKAFSSSDDSPPPTKNEYGESPTTNARATGVGQQTSLHRDLKARHITMIAIGGAIGTGLVIGTYESLNCTTDDVRGELTL